MGWWRVRSRVEPRSFGAAAGPAVRPLWKKATKLHVSQMSTEELEHYFIVITSVPKQKKTGFFPEELNDDGHLNGKFFY